LDALLKFVM
jgi:hypothetical protein